MTLTIGMDSKKNFTWDFTTTQAFVCVLGLLSYVNLLGLSRD